MVSSSDRETIVYVAKLAQQAECYDDAVEGLMKLAKMDVNLTTEERLLLSVCYKKVYFTRRASWRILSSIEKKVHYEPNAKLIKEYRQKVEAELTNICSEIIDVVDKHLIPSCTDGDAMVFYLKMNGDYFRYLAEFETGDDRKVDVEQAQIAYEEAISTAEIEQLPWAHPVRLGLALNFAVFHCKTLKSTERACILAKQAYDEAVPLLDTLDEESRQITNLLLQLLEKNLKRWANGDQSDDAENSANEASSAGGDGAE